MPIAIQEKGQDLKNASIMWFQMAGSGREGYFEQLWSNVAIDKFTEESIKKNPTLPPPPGLGKYIVPYTM